MKKIFTLAAAAMITSAAFTVNAEVIPGMTVLEPSGNYVSSVNYIRLAWDYDTDTDSGATLKLMNKTITLTLIYNGKEYSFNPIVNSNPTIENSNTLVISMANIPDLKPGQGEYSLTIPERYVSIDGVANTEASVSFTVVGNIQGNPTITPKGGAVTVADVDGKTITIDYGSTYTNLSANTDAGNITATYTNNGADPVTETITGYSFNGSVLSFALKSGIQDNSTITVTVPQNFVIAQDAEGNTCVGGGTTINYNVWNGLPEATVLQTMGLDTPSVMPVKVMWDNYQPLELVGSNLPLDLYFWNSGDSQGLDEPDVEMTVYPDYSFENGPDGQKNAILVINVQNVVDQVKQQGYVPTCYYFNLPEGVIQSAGRINPYQKHLILFQLPYTITNIPATIYNNVTETLIIYFDSPTIFSRKNGNIHDSAYLVAPDGQRTPVNDFKEESDVELGYYQVVDLSNFGLSDPSTYTLYVPWGYFGLNYIDEYGIYIPGVNCEWNLPIKTAPGQDNESSGIEEIGTSESPAQYYDLTGRRIMNPEKGKVTIVVKDGKTSKVIF